MQVLSRKPATADERRRAEQLLARARSRLLLDAPWFGSLALRLDVVLDDTFPGLAATDGTRVIFNPREVHFIPERCVTTVLAHEVLHCALLHLWRLGARDRELWNIAADHAINLALQENNFPFPPTGPWQGLKDPRFKGMSAEQIYAILRDESPPPPPEGWVPDLQDPQSGDGQEGTGKMTAGDWQIATEQATVVARRAGRLPAGVERLIGQVKEASVDWRAVLRDFVDHTIPSDYRWTRPNRRHIADGLYLPGVYKENAPRFVVAVDTSGSITQPMLDQMAGELTTILSDVRPERLDVVYCDAAIQGTASFEPDGAPVELKFLGGGGTAFKPVFDWVAKSGDEPACLIYLTDLESSDTPVKPDFPVLWGTTLKTDRKGPFGDTIRVVVE